MHLLRAGADHQFACTIWRLERRFSAAITLLVSSPILENAPTNEAGKFSTATGSAQ
jgi:hypothetical protein